MLRLADPGNRRATLCWAAGSASETQVALRLAMARHILSERARESARATAAHTVATLWQLTRGLKRTAARRDRAETSNN